MRMTELLKSILFAGVRGKHSVLRAEPAEAGRPEGSSCAVGAPALDADEHPGVAAPAGKVPYRSALRVVPFKGVAKPPVKRVALLLDAENIGSRFVRGALEVARSEGEVVIAKAYGPASVIGSKSWGAVLQREGLDSHICTGCRKGKNSVDMHVAVDAMQMVLQLGIDVLVVVSSDSDFAPLAARVRQQGKRFHGIGQKLPTSTYPFLCDQWTNLVEIEDAPSDLGQGMLKRIERAARDSGVEEGVIIDLVECAQMLSMKGQWVDVSQLSNDVRLIRPEFNPKACGCASFKKLLEKTKLFEFSSAGTTCKVRLKAA